MVLYPLLVGALLWFYVHQAQRETRRFIEAQAKALMAPVLALTEWHREQYLARMAAMAPEPFMQDAAPDPLAELVGHECQVEFTGEPRLWPFEGWPVWVTVEAVSMPMVKLRSRWCDDAKWINLGTIKSIERRS